MAEENVRPAWQSPSGAAVPAPAATVPSWERVARKTLDLRLVIPILIGLVSVTGAVMAWQSALAGEKATDKDRQAVAETVQLAEGGAGNDLIIQDARIRFADHAASVSLALSLDRQVDQLRQQGNDEVADLTAQDAIEVRAVGRRVLFGGLVDLSPYVGVADDGSATFDESQLRVDLRQTVEDEEQVNPNQTIREANRLREQSERLDLWLIAMVGAIVLLTLAQVSRRRLLKIGLLGAGVATWVVVSILGFSGQ